MKYEKYGEKVRVNTETNAVEMWVPLPSKEMTNERMADWKVVEKCSTYRDAHIAALLLLVDICQ